MNKTKILIWISCFIITGSPILNATTVLADANDKKVLPTDQIKGENRITEEEKLVAEKENEISPVSEFHSFDIQNKKLESIKDEEKIIENEIIEFSSLNVATAVSKLLKIDLTYTFTAEELAKITTLTVAASDEDTEDLAKLTNLTKLVLNKGTLTSIDFVSNLPKLTILYMDSTKVTDISPVQNLTQLLELSISSNNLAPITTVSTVSKVVTLQKLVMQNNKVEDISSFSSLQNLTHLDLNNNLISDISSISSLKNLKIAYFEGNNIEDISPVKELPVIEFLSFNKSKRSIEDLSPISNLKTLKKLWITNAGISDLSALSSLTELYYLQISNNQIEDVRPLSSLTKLSELYIANNQISDLSAVPNLATLKGLDAKNQKITLPEEQPVVDNKVVVPVLNFDAVLPAFNAFTFSSTNGIFEESTQTMSWEFDGVLSKSYNFASENGKYTGTVNLVTEGASKEITFKSEKVATAVSKLLKIDLTYTFTAEQLAKITTLTVAASDEDTEDLAKLTNLTKLVLNKGTLTSIDFVSNLPKLTILYMDSTKVEDITPVQNLTQLLELSISSNNLAPISTVSTVSKVVTLQKLVMQNNKVEDISSFSALQNLTHLDVNNNLISDISSISLLKNLKIAYFEGNNIEDISPVKELPVIEFLSFKKSKQTIEDISPVSNLKTLQKLWISNAGISDLSVLSSLTELYYLEISNNQIEDVRPLASLTKLSELYVANNQISDLSAVPNLATLKVLDAKNQKITLPEEQAIVDNKVVVPVLNFDAVLPAFNAFTFSSTNGIFDENTHTMSWEFDGSLSKSYNFASENGKYAGVVIVPINKIEAPIVDPLVSSDTVIRGKAEAKATIIAKVEGVEIGKGEANEDETFELTIASQVVGTIVRVTQTIGGMDSPEAVVVVEKGDTLKAYNTYKLGYWRSFGFVLEGQSGIEGQISSNKEDVLRIVELVNTQTNQVETRVTAVNTNWYTLTNYDGYQAIITNEMIEKLASGNYCLQVAMTLKDGKIVKKNLRPNNSSLARFIGEYQEDVVDLGKQGVGAKAVQFSDSIDQIIMNVSQGTNQVNVLNSRVNASGDNVADVWIASETFDFQQEHSKYLVITDSSGKEVYNEKSPTWNINTIFGRQVKPEWERSGVQAIIPKAYRGSTYKKEIIVKDAEKVIQIETTINENILY